MTTRLSQTTISGIDLRPLTQTDPEKMALVKDYKVKIEHELVKICADILSIIVDKLVPNSTNEEGKVFYYKMKGEFDSPPIPFLSFTIFFFSPFSTECGSFSRPFYCAPLPLR
jgi:hypothetical protein